MEPIRTDLMSYINSTHIRTGKVGGMKKNTTRRGERAKFDLGTFEGVQVDSIERRHKIFLK